MFFIDSDEEDKDEEEEREGGGGGKRETQLTPQERTEMNRAKVSPCTWHHVISHVMSCDMSCDLGRR